jgi:hypothetical protein
MGLMDVAIADAAEFTANDNDFGVEILLTAPNEQTATVNGYATKHHLKLDASSGQVVNAKNASVVVSEANILAANPNYPVRILDQASPFYREVKMIKHLVSVADSSGVIKNYQCAENFADEALGLITLILEDYSG